MATVLNFGMNAPIFKVRIFCGKVQSPLWRAAPLQASRVRRSLKAVGVDGFDGFKET